MYKTILAVAAVILFSVSLWGQQANPPNVNNQAALEQRIRDLEDRVIALEGKLRTLESTPAPQPAQPQLAKEGQATAPQAAQVPPATVPAQPSPNETQAGLASPAAGGQLPVYGGASAASKALNPDVSVIGDFIGAAGGNSPPPNISPRR